MSSFKASIHVSKVNGSPNTDSLMEMASFCDKILRREDNEGIAIMTVTIVV